MEFNEYQQLAFRTRADNDNRDFAIAILALGLAGEAGETADYVKKYLGHGHKMDLQKLKSELGDCLWYLSQVAQIFNLSLSEIAEFNIDKLRKRYPSGFSTEASIARLDTQSLNSLLANVDPNTCAVCGKPFVTIGPGSCKCRTRDPFGV